MNLNRWIVVPIAALCCFGLAYGVAALIGLVWLGMPVGVRWGIPVAFTAWYLIDCIRREQPQK